MAKSLSLGLEANQARVFQCPNCKETINTSMQQCGFCSTPIDPGAAAAAADAMGKVNQACSDASYLKIQAGATVVFFIGTFVPFVALIARFGLVFLAFALPVMTIRWWVRFANIKTDDPDFVRARRIVMVVGVVSVPVFLLVVGGIVAAFV